MAESTKIESQTLSADQEQVTGAGAGDATHDFGDKWVALKDACVHNDDGTYTAPDGTVYSEEGYFVSGPELSHEEPVNTQSSEADNADPIEAWKSYIGSAYYTIDRAIFDDKKAAQGGRWSRSESLKKALVQAGLYTQDEIDNDAMGREDTRVALEAYRALRDEHAPLRDQAKADIAKLKGAITSTDTEHIAYRQGEAEKILPHRNRLNEIVAEDRKAYILAHQNDDPNAKRWRSGSARKRALVEQGVYTQEFVDRLKYDDVTRLFDDARTLQGGGEIKTLTAVETLDPNKPQTGDTPPGTSQQPLTEAEQKRQERMAELTRQIHEKNGLLSVKLALKGTRGRVGDPNDSTTQMDIIRKTLVTLKMFGDESEDAVARLTDTEVLVLTQSAVDEANAETAAETAAARLRITGNIDAAYLANAQQALDNGDTAEAVRILRAQLVSTGSLPPLDVGNLTDDEVLALVGMTSAQLPAPGTRAAPAVPAVPPPGAPPYTPPAAPARPVSLPAPGTRAAPTIAVSTSPNQRAGANPNILLQKQIELEDARTEWAKLSAKRQRRPIVSWFLKRTDAYRRVEENYARLRREVEALELAPQLAGTQDREQKRFLCDMYLLNEESNLRAEEKGFVENRLAWKVAHGISEWMQRGNKKVRIAKRFGLGAVAAGVALIPGVNLGTAGLVVFGALRVTRARLMHTVGGIDQLTTEQSDELKKQRLSVRAQTDNEIMEHRTRAFERVHEKDNNKKGLKRIGARALTLFMLGAGYAAGEGAHYAANKISDFWNGVSHQGTSSGSGGTREIASPSTGSGHEGVPGQTQATTGHDILNANGAYTVRPGEGWDETFRDMGIPQDNWADVLKDAGPKLHDLGVADFDSDSNQWWISRSGNLPTDALRAIADSSAKFGYVFNKF